MSDRAKHAGIASAMRGDDTANFTAVRIECGGGFHAMFLVGRGEEGRLARFYLPSRRLEGEGYHFTFLLLRSLSSWISSSSTCERERPRALASLSSVRSALLDKTKLNCFLSLFVSRYLRWLQRVLTV